VVFASLKKPTAPQRCNLVPNKKAKRVDFKNHRQAAGGWVIQDDSSEKIADRNLRAR